MLPSELYQIDVQTKKIVANTHQMDILSIFDDLCTQLNSENNSPNFLTTCLKKILPPKKIKGLYVWGNVGVGKTYLMDLFYRSLEVPKIRIHFHAFMQRVHQELKQLQGQKNPLVQLAKKISQEAKVLCFDEFHVKDIADAMLLGGLLKALFKAGICFIASSNVAPDDLYKEGLQRERFLPVIELIKEKTRVYYLYSKQDYRLRHVQEAGVYYAPADEKAVLHLELCFQLFSKDEPVSTDPLIVLGRPITVIKHADRTLWINFINLCSVPRSQNDYLELVKEYRTWLISNIPVIQTHQYDLITNFIHLIDVLYDAKVRVVISADTPIEQLYPSGRFIAEFQRTKSRLIEMQSEDYFSPGSIPKAEDI